MFNPEFLTSDSEPISGNSLIQYLQEQSPDVLQRVARSASGDIQDIIRHNVQGLLGMIPGEQFDVKIGTFQALQHRLATAYCELELAAASVFNALLAMDKSEPILSEHASKAKALVGDILQLLSNEAVQMHGGMGVTDEMDIGLLLKRSRTWNQLFGNSAFHRNRVATLRGF